MKSNAYKGHLAMLGANLLWGCMSPSSKIVLSSGLVNAISLTTFRMLGAAAVFWIASLFTKDEHVSHQDLVKLFFAALFGIVFNQGSYIFGVSLTSPIDATIVATTTPIITMIIAAFYLKEPVTGKKILGIFVGAIGALLLILSGQQAVAGNGNGSNIWGDILCLVAQCCFSIYVVVYKGLISRYSPVTLMKWMFTYSAICTIPFSYTSIASIDFLRLPTSIYLNIAVVVLGGTFFAYLLVPIGQRILRPTVATMYNYVQPIVASAITVLVGLDTFGIMKCISIALVFSGVYIVTQSKSKSQLDAYKAQKELQEKQELIRK
ncbi:DMT family transporter [Parabacteroides sp. AM08-6]|uniref:DMT family transporter n=1 Tax=Parabacteroides sp. AM08-6 TaxID=2292053 RepID=UPI000EFF9A9E|nr:DMT family transporter [Parabacteroides sp. AM08-6]RHJ85372.1 DMT family transporter [Parabacteroides sp. AM08-6]